MTLFRRNTTPRLEMPGIPTSKIGYLKIGPRFFPIKRLECRKGILTSRVELSGVAHIAVSGLVGYYDHQGHEVLGEDWDQTANPLYVPVQARLDTLGITHNIRQVPAKFAHARRVVDLRGLPQAVNRTWSLHVG